MRRFREAWIMSHTSHRHHLTKAAGIATVELVCHQDTWGQIEYLTKKRRHYDLPSDPGISESDQMPSMTLSGVDLTEILEAMRITWTEQELIFGKDDVAHYAPFDHVKVAVAKRIYLAVATAVEATSVEGGKGVRLPPIVIDDRLW